MIESARLIQALVFLSVVTFLFAVMGFARYRSQRKALVAKIKEESRPRVSTGSASSTPPPQKGLKGWLLRSLHAMGKRTQGNRTGGASFVRKALARAGYRGQNALATFYGLKLSGAALLPGAFFLFHLIAPVMLRPATFMAAGIALALGGFYLPNLVVKVKTSVRKERILEGFPDALDLMVVCVEAGMGLDAAIQRVGEEMRVSSPVVAEEFKLLSLELRAGQSRSEALRNLAMRTDIEDIASLVSLLIQTDRFGTSVAQALRVHSDAMRLKRRQKAEEMAAKVAVKLVFPLILGIFPSLFVVIAGPAGIQIYRVLLPQLGGG